MDFAPIPSASIPKVSALFQDYVTHFGRVAHFYNGSPYDPECYKTAAGRLQKNTSGRAELAEILTRQNREFGCGDVTLANIKRLAEPGTMAVVTGQQVGLFSGPAFTLYKALTAVRLAQSLSQNGFPVVPVFWLATEDHDLEEVAQAATFDEEYNLIDWKDPGERPAPRSPVGYVKLSSEISATLTRLESSLPSGEFRDQVLRDLREGYQSGASWGHAFGCFLTRLFSRWGVVLLDPLEDSIHRLCSFLYERVLSHTSQLRARLAERSETLVSTGYHAQVHVGEDSTLLFVTHEGNRKALRENGGEFSLDGAGSISNTELQALVDERPLDFSANALLRPVIQDTLLPTIAYVAGPSELAYLAQSNVLYAELGRPQPIIFPRATFTLVDVRTQRLMEKYRITVGDAWQGEEHLRRAIASHAFAEGWSSRLDRADKELTQLLERLRQDVEAIDPTLLDTLKRTEEKMKHDVDRLKGKISRAAMEKSDLLARHEHSLLRFITPKNQLQEREVSGAYFLGKAGYGILDRLLASIRLDTSDHQVVSY